jgi:hypothetical protein
LDTSILSSGHDARVTITNPLPLTTDGPSVQLPTVLKSPPSTNLGPGKQPLKDIDTDLKKHPNLQTNAQTNAQPIQDSNEDSTTVSQTKTACGVPNLPRIQNTRFCDANRTAKSTVINARAKAIIKAGYNL